MTIDEDLKNIKDLRALSIINNFSKAYPKHPVQINYYPNLGIVQIGERKVELTPLENKVMDYLYKNAGKPRTMDELSEEVLGKQSTIVKDTIYKLRAKIEPNSRRPQYIVYVKGVGYVLKNVI